MTKYEYKVETYKGFTLDFAKRHTEILNEAGKDGWKLVQIIPGTPLQYFYMREVN